MDEQSPAALGFRLVMTWRELELEAPTEEEVYETLRGLPRDGVVFVLSRFAQVLLARGQAAGRVQEEFVYTVLPEGAFRNRVLELLKRGYLFGTHAGLIALVRLSLAHSPPGKRELGEEQRLAILRLLPTINAEIGGGRGLLERADEPGQGIRVSRLSSFLAVNSPVPSDADQWLLRDWSFGALIAEKVESSKRSSRTSKKLLQTIGRDFRQLHTMVYRVLGQYSVFKEGIGEYRDVAHLLPTGSNDGPLSMYELVQGLTVPTNGVQAATLRSVASPPTAWDDETCWRPLFRSDEWVVCWEPRILRRLASFNFPEVLRGIAEPLRIRATDAWNVGVEEAIQEAIELLVGTQNCTRLSPGLLGAAIPPESNRIADWAVVHGDDLFIVEWKNLSLPRSSFGEPNLDSYERWVKDQLVGKQGFAQVYNTISRATRRLERPGSKPARPLSSFQRIWPVVLIPFSFPMDPIGANYLRSLVEHMATSDDGPEIRVQEPLVLGMWEFLPVLALGPQEAGPLLKHWCDAGMARTSLATTYLHNIGRGIPNVAQVIRRGSASLAQVIESIKDMDL